MGEDKSQRERMRGTKGRKNGRTSIGVTHGCGVGLGSAKVEFEEKVFGQRLLEIQRLLDPARECNLERLVVRLVPFAQPWRHRPWRVVHEDSGVLGDS